MPTRVVTRTRTRAIRTPDIVHGFLDNAKVSEPEEYVKQACFESSAFLPIYHYLRQAKMKKDAAIAFVSKSQSRSPACERLAQRLASDTDQSLQIPNTSSRATQLKRQYQEALIKKELTTELKEREMVYALQAMRTLSKNQVSAALFRPILKEWFSKYYTSKSPSLADNLRRAICFLDEVLNRDYFLDA